MSFGVRHICWHTLLRNKTVRASMYYKLHWLAVAAISQLESYNRDPAVEHGLADPAPLFVYASREGPAPFVIKPPRHLD